MSTVVVAFAIASIMGYILAQFIMLVAEKVTSMPVVYALVAFALLCALITVVAVVAVVLPALGVVLT